MADSACDKRSTFRQMIDQRMIRGNRSEMPSVMPTGGESAARYGGKNQHDYMDACSEFLLDPREFSRVSCNGRERRARASAESAVGQTPSAEESHL